jgi:hypothetical protein
MEPVVTGLPRILFICGSMNQTTQMHQIARQMPDCDHAFTPYYVDGVLELARRAGLAEFTIVGDKLRNRCMAYLEREGLPIDLGGRDGTYDMVVTCSDLVMPRNVLGNRVVVVQEGLLDQAKLAFRACKAFPFLPLWLAGTSTTGLSGQYQRFCVASEGYRDVFVANGVPAEKIVVTGIPNFDDCRRYLDTAFPYRGFVLVCSSDARETFKRHDRAAFLRRCVAIAAGRPLIFKLHPNEGVDRATQEIRAVAPDALVFSTGSAEEMIACCDVLVTQYSSTALVGLALGKEVHADVETEALRRLVPVQDGGAARRIAAVGHELLAAPALARERRATSLAAVSRA